MGMYCDFNGFFIIGYVRFVGEYGVFCFGVIIEEEVVFVW